MPRGKAAEGRSNRSRGAYHEEAWLTILREYYPHAERTFPRVDGFRVGDYTGIGDLCMEATIEGWARMGSATANPDNSKIAEVCRDARNLGYDLWCVIKGVVRNGARTQWFLVGDARAWLRILVRLDELEQIVCERNDEWQAGYDAAKREGKAR